MPWLQSGEQCTDSSSGGDLGEHHHAYPLQAVQTAGSAYAPYVFLDSTIAPRNTAVDISKSVPRAHRQSCAQLLRIVPVTAADQLVIALDDFRARQHGPRPWEPFAFGEATQSGATARAAHPRRCLSDPILQHRPDTRLDRRQVGVGIGALRGATWATATQQLQRFHWGE